MGACFSNVKGGRVAVEGAQQQTMNSGGASTGGAAHNDAVDSFFRTKDLKALSTQIEENGKIRRNKPTKYKNSQHDLNGKEKKPEMLKHDGRAHQKAEELKSSVTYFNHLCTVDAFP